MKTEVQTITHILCDLSDVLIKGMEGSNVFLAKEMKLDSEKVSEELFSYDFRPLWLGRVSEYEFITRLIKDRGWNIPVKRFMEIIKENFYEIEGTRDIYSKLKEKYTLILLSVNAKEWVNYLDNKYHYSDLFDKVVYSFDIGYTKRESGSFAYILNTLNVKPNNVLLIDDSSRNLATAKAMGIEGIKFIDTRQLKDSLFNLNLL